MDSDRMHHVHDICAAREDLKDRQLMRQFRQATRLRRELREARLGFYAASAVLVALLIVVLRSPAARSALLGGG